MATTCERLLPRLKYIAAQLTGDYHLQEDLVQEMAISVLEAGPDHYDIYYLQLAEWRAVDYLKRFGKFPLLGLDENR